MLSELEHAARRFAVFSEEVLAPAVYPAREPLEVAVHQCAEAIRHQDAAGADYRPVEIGWRWGPAWSTAWFRLRGRAGAAAAAGGPLALRFACGTEALLWIDGVPVQGFDDHRDEHRLGETDGAELEFFVEAACNRPLGVTTFWWDGPGAAERWRSPTPGHLTRAEIAAVDPAVWALRETYDLAHALVAQLTADSDRGHRLVDALGRATAALDDADVAGTAGAAAAILDEALAAPAAANATRCFATGHAHIDTAWLWPTRETRRKCLRTFASALRLMERHPEYTFLCSQAQQYAWVERDAPALFAQIAARVREGRWEAAGAAWVEPDCNVPSGEALVRQILHGTRYWRDRFGDDAPQRLLYLPDSFGFPAALPQIMAAAGLDTFITNKLSWNEKNEFPHVSFRWRGLDGTEVLAHCTPGHDYNATLAPLELRRGARNAARQDRGLTGVWLQPFGYGDGGGGPTAAMIHRALAAADTDGLPRVRLATAGAFCEELHRRRAALLAQGRDLPVWDGELYLELHRGTYTSQGWLKRANRRAEAGLREAEWLLAGAPVPAEGDLDRRAGADLRDAWETLLLNQFHDILPGCSIGEVYDEGRADHARIRVRHETIAGAAAARWTASADTRDRRRPMLVFNPGSHARSGVVACEDQLHYAADVPALGARVVDRAEAAPSAPAPPAPARARDFTLSNGLLEATIDEAGRVSGLRRAGSARDARGPGAAPLNQLVLYEDRPRSWEAWDIDAEYTEKPRRLDDAAESRRVELEGPLRAAVEVTRPLGRRSRITQRYVLDAGSPRLDIETRVDWQEDRRLLRALFPVDVRARRATYEIQFGHIERASHRNTSWEQAMFEVCAHAWADLSEPGFGVALLNDGKYGHSCDGNVLGLSLLRSPRFPDPEADRGEQVFTYSLMVHDGDWRAAGVDRAAADLNAPMRAVPVPPGQTGGAIAPAWAPVVVTGDAAAGVVIAALKGGHDDDRVILRLVETHGRRGTIEVAWKLPVTAVEPVDLLERDAPAEGVEHDAAGRRTTCAVGPFRIITLAATVARTDSRS